MKIILVKISHIKYLLLLILSLFVSCESSKKNSETKTVMPMLVSEIYFPDANLRGCMERNYNDIDRVTVMICSQTIGDLTGLEYLEKLEYIEMELDESVVSFSASSFKNLKTLYLQDAMGLSSLDVSELEKLERLHVINSSIDNLKLNPNLIELWVTGSLLADLDLSENSALTFLNVSYSFLRSVDLSSVENLEYINLEKNEITSLQLSQEASLLRRLNVSSNKLSEIDLCSTPALMELDIGNNLFNAVDLSCLQFLRSLAVDNNQLGTIDLSSNLLLTGLIVEGNQFSELDLKELQSLKQLYAANNALNSLLMAENVQLSEVDISGNSINCSSLGQTITSSECFDGPGLRIRDVVSEHPNLEPCMGRKDRSDSVYRLKELNCSSIKSPQGLDQFIRLERLYMSYAEFETLNLTVFADLNMLSVFQTSIRDLIIDQNQGLKELYLDSLPIEKLDLSTNINLEEVFVSGAEHLQEIAFPSNANIKWISLWKVGLLYLDLVDLEQLETLSVVSTNIESIILPQSNNLNSLEIRQTNIKHIDLIGMPNLRNLTLNTSSVKQIDLTPALNLEYLDLSQNNLDSITVPEDSSIEDVDLRFNNLSGLTLPNNLSEELVIMLEGNPIACVDLEEISARYSVTDIERVECIQ